MKTSSEGIDFIKSFETLQLKAYKAVPTERYYTIGYGHCRPDVTPDATITEDEAERLLAEDLADTERAVSNATAGWNLQQCQFDALVSFAFNVGANAFRNSTLLKLVKQGACEADIRAEFGKWIHSGACQETECRGGSVLLGEMIWRIKYENAKFSPFYCFCSTLFVRYGQTYHLDVGKQGFGQNRI